VNWSVKDYVGHRGIDDGCRLVFDRQLTGDDGGGQLAAVIHDFEDVAALGGP